MPLEVDFLNAVLNKLTEDKVYFTSVGCDIVVPDSKPDVIKIISVTARTDVKEVNVKKDRITFLGTANYDIVYFSDSEEERIKTITFQSPLSYQDDFFGFSEGDSISVEAVCHKCVFNLQNSRKISVNTPVEFRVFAIHNQMIDMAGIDSRDYPIPSLSEKVSPLNRVISINDRFSVSDSVAISDYEVYEIIKTDSSLIERDFKIISNKTFVKGTIMHTIIFFDVDMKIHSMCHCTDFSEVIETRNLSNDMIADVSFEVVGVGAEVFFEAEKTDVELKTDIRITLVGYEELDMELIYDAYCPYCKTDLIKEKIDILELVAMGEESITLKDIIDFEKEHCEKVALVEGDIRIRDKKIENGKIKTSGVVTVSVTYITDNNSVISSKTKDIEFESITDAEKCVSEDKVSTRAYFKEFDTNYLPGNKAEITLSVVMEHMVLRQSQKEYIKSVSLDEGCIYDKKNDVSITIHFAKEDDSLWDIAKSYHTTIEEIIRVNGIDEKIPLKKRQQILIPKHI